MTCTNIHGTKVFSLLPISYLIDHKVYGTVVFYTIGKRMVSVSRQRRQLLTLVFFVVDVKDQVLVVNVQIRESETNRIRCSPRKLRYSGNRRGTVQHNSMG